MELVCDLSHFFNLFYLVFFTGTYFLLKQSFMFLLVIFLVFLSFSVFSVILVEFLTFLLSQKCHLFRCHSFFKNHISHTNYFFFLCSSLYLSCLSLSLLSSFTSFSLFLFSSFLSLSSLSSLHSTYLHEKEPHYFYFSPLVHITSPSLLAVPLFSSTDSLSCRTL